MSDDVPNDMELYASIQALKKMFRGSLPIRSKYVVYHLVLNRSIGHKWYVWNNELRDDRHFKFKSGEYVATYEEDF